MALTTSGFACVARSEEDPYVWRVTAFARSHNESREVAELVASRVIGYFDAERHGLCEKMSAWFDQQIYHQRRKGEDTSALEQQKRDALAAEETKAFVVRKQGLKSPVGVEKPGEEDDANLATIF